MNAFQRLLVGFRYVIRYFCESFQLLVLEFYKPAKERLPLIQWLLVEIFIVFILFLAVTFEVMMRMIPAPYTGVAIFGLFIVTVICVWFVPLITSKYKEKFIFTKEGFIGSVPGVMAYITSEGEVIEEGSVMHKKDERLFVHRTFEHAKQHSMPIHITFRKGVSGVGEDFSQIDLTIIAQVAVYANEYLSASSIASLYIKHEIFAPSLGAHIMDELRKAIRDQLGIFPTVEVGALPQRDSIELLGRVAILLGSVRYACTIKGVEAVVLSLSNCSSEGGSPRFVGHLVYGSQEVDLSQLH